MTSSLFPSHGSSMTRCEKARRRLLLTAERALAALRARWADERQPLDIFEVLTIGPTGRRSLAVVAATGEEACGLVPAPYRAFQANRLGAAQVRKRRVIGQLGGGSGAAGSP